VAKLPLPPRPLDLPPEWTVLPAGKLLWRAFFRGGAHPVRWNDFRVFGPMAASRFDPHDPPPRLQGRGILYAADHGRTCLAEVFQETRVIDRADREPWLVGFRLNADLRLLDLTGLWPTRAGASMAICAGRRDRSRAWSRAIYEAYPGAGGLIYPSSMYAHQPAVALYERARPALPGGPAFHRPLSDPALHTVLRNAAAELGYRLA